jgi:hypothetical protein
LNKSFLNSDALLLNVTMATYREVSSNMTYNSCLAAGNATIGKMYVIMMTRVNAEFKGNNPLGKTKPAQSY